MNLHGQILPGIPVICQVTRNPGKTIFYRTIYQTTSQKEIYRTQSERVIYGDGEILDQAAHLKLTLLPLRIPVDDRRAALVAIPQSA